VRETDSFTNKTTCTISVMTKKTWLFIFFLSIAFSAWLSIIFFSINRADVDEKVHYRQISRFVKGNYEILPNLTTIPGYHVVIALFSKIGGYHSLEKTRIISLALSLITIWVFFIISKRLKVNDPHIKTLQFMFLPISFLYFPLLYTDIPSLLFVLIAFYFSIKKQYYLSALFSLVAILTRQNNIIWIIFIWTYNYVSIYGFSISMAKIIAYLRLTIAHIGIFAAFALFLFFNHGVAIGDKTNHVAGLYLGNIYLFLAITGLLFLPIIITSTFHKINLCKTKKFLAFGLGAGFLLASSFVLFPPQLHNGNLKLTFLMNIVLKYAYGEYAYLYAIAIFLGCIFIFIAKIEKTNLLFLPFAALYLAPSFLVAQRYSIIPLVFLLLFKKETDKKSELVLLVYFLILSLALIYIVFNTAIDF